jgi:DNA helicase-2/ATP-dependent DNA helicase PcrA
MDQALNLNNVTMEKLGAGLKPGPPPLPQQPSTALQPMAAGMPVLKGDARRAVLHRGSHLQILAGAGTGKTEVMRQRVVSLLADGFPPESIVAVTFNIDAGEELKRRVEEGVKAHPRLGPGFLDRMCNCYIGTLHSYAYQLLQRHVPKFETYDVLDDHRLAAILSREANRIGLKALTGAVYSSIKAFIANFDVVQNELIPTEVLDEPFRSILKAFLERLEAYRLLTYGQQIALAVRELDRPEVFNAVHSTLRHLMVDEYQDINPAQERLIELLSTPPVELCVVGDDDQSIYQWRGTNVDNIVKFSERYPGVATYRISKNRRSVPEIVELANRFAATIKGRLPKKMDTDRPARGAAVSIWSEPTEADEARRIAETIQQLSNRGYRFGDMAVLFRGWGAYAALVKALDDCRIPVMAGGRTGLFQQPDAKLFGRTLAFLAGIDWGDEPYGPRNPVTIGQLEMDYAARFGLSQEKRSSVRQRLEEWSEKVHADVPANLVGDYHQLLEACSIDEWDLNDAVAAARAGTLARCTAVLADFESVRRRARPDPESAGEQIGGLDRGKYFYFNLATYVQNWAHGAYEGYDGSDKLETNAVELTTVHGAKGLEWPVVFVASLSAKRFPSSRTGDAGTWFVPAGLFDRERYEGTLNDERRLFYVAITRPRDWLSLSTHDAVTKKSVGPSPFLREIAPEWPPKERKLQLPESSRNGGPDAEELITLSFSELSAFASCGHAYRLRVDLGFQAPLAQELGYGKAIHHILRSVAELSRKSGEPPSGEQLDALFKEDFYLPAATKPAHKHLKRAARDLVGGFVEKHGRDLTNVYAVERPFELHLSNAVVSGRADVIIRKSPDTQPEFELDDYKVSEDADLAPYDRQLRTYTSAGRREGLNIIEANIFDLRKKCKRSVDISPEKVQAVESEVIELVDRLKARDFVPSPGRRCRDCDVRRLCKYRES